MADQDRVAAPELEEVIAKIESTWLGYEDHGIFSLNVGFTYGPSAQGTGHCAASRPYLLRRASASCSLTF